MATIERAPVTGPRPPSVQEPRKGAARRILEAILTLLAGGLYVISWLTGLLLFPLWWALVWCAAVWATGWAEGSAVWRDR